MACQSTYDREYNMGSRGKILKKLEILYRSDGGFETESLELGCLHLVTDERCDL